MLKRSTALVLVTALCAACAGEAPDESSGAVADASADEQALEELRAYWETHYNMHHADMVASTYADSAWTLPADGGWIQGRPAIEADLAEGMAGSPTATIQGADILLMGDLGATMGTYSVSVTPEGGESTGWSGAYLNLVTRQSGEWKILGSITNYDAARPEGWSWVPPMTDPPADEGTMADVVDYFATHWNMGHASMVADLYTDDAMASFSNGPILQGRAAIEEAIAASLESGAQLTIHDVGTLPMGEGWAADGGWYQLDAPGGGDAVQRGSYLNILRQQADGSWKIHRMLSNAQPPAM